MGQGTRHKPEVPKRVSRVDIADLSASGGHEVDLPEAGEDTVCERSQTVAFEATGQVEPPIGLKVWLVLGDPPEVRSASGTVGRIAPAAANEMAGCLRLGYAMRGVVTRFARESATGSVRISGQRSAAA